MNGNWSLSIASGLKNLITNNGVIMGIKLELTINETNLILASLGKQSYEAVAGLINKIQQQGGPQAEQVAAEEAKAAEAETAAE